MIVKAGELDGEEVEEFCRQVVEEFFGPMPTVTISYGSLPNFPYACLFYGNDQYGTFYGRA